MAQRIIATSGAGAIVAPSQVPFTLSAKHFRNNMRPVISVQGLAGVETVSWWKLTNAAWEEIADSTGTQISFTATYAADVFNGPGQYGYTKSATVGTIVVTLDDGV